MNFSRVSSRSTHFYKMWDIFLSNVGLNENWDVISLSFSIRPCLLTALYYVFKSKTLIKNPTHKNSLYLQNTLTKIASSNRNQQGQLVYYHYSKFRPLPLTWADRRLLVGFPLAFQYLFYASTQWFKESRVSVNAFVMDGVSFCGMGSCTLCI